jgi:molydopterin dinucleotide binding protein
VGRGRDARAGRIVVRAEVDDSLRAGQIALPHGFGMAVPDGRGGRVVHGPRINLLTDAADRDPIAGTPHHKDVRAARTRDRRRGGGRRPEGRPGSGTDRLSHERHRRPAWTVLRP